MPPPRRPEPGAWTRWDEAVAPVLDAPPHPLAGLGFVGLIGADGSGKTFLLDRLCAGLAAEGVSHRRVWSRFRNYLSKPLLALTRLTGHNVKVDHPCGVRVGYHDFRHSRALGLSFVALQALDQLLDLACRYRGRRLIVGDRCVLDTLVDLAVDTGLDDLVIDRLGPLLVRLLPRPRLVVLVSRPVALVRRDRPDALLDRHFMRRRALYERLAARFGIPVVENGGPAEAAVARVLSLARGGDPAPPPAGATSP
jgi:thymidylate kinase